MAEVRCFKGNFQVKVEYWDNERAKGLPQRVWDKAKKYWIAPLTRPNAKYLRSTFHTSEIAHNAQEQIDRLDTRPKGEPFPEYYPFDPDYPPMAHQMQGLNDAWGHPGHALFFDMRLGKTYTALHLAQARYHFQGVERLLVICPTPIKAVWEDEICKFLDPDVVDMFVMESGLNHHAERWMRGHDNAHLQILVVGVEALSQGGAYGVARQFMLGGVPSMVVIDESSRIKNFKSKRTEKCILLGERADFRLILTGTPITQGMHDLYSQFEFLGKNIMGQKSYYTFRNRYMIMGGFEGRQVLGYRNAHEMLELVEPYSTVVKKEQVYDLPTIPPQTRVIQPTKEQRSMFAELKHYMRTVYEDEALEARTILERMTRFQQINGGNFPYPDGKDHKGKTLWNTKPLATNPKLLELESMLDELGDQQVIIWARFVPEIKAIANMLANNGKSVVTFYGDTLPTEREAAKVDFQSKSAQYFVGNQAVGGMGIKLSAADVAIYYSNTFSYEDRQQSWARPEEIGMKDAVLYIDLVLNTVIDKAIMAAQEKKGGMAKFVDSNLQKIKSEIQ